MQLQLKIIKDRGSELGVRYGLRDIFKRSGALTVDLAPGQWKTTYGSSGQKRIVGVSDLVSGILYNVLSIDPGTTVGGVHADNVIDKFVAQKNPSEIDVALSSGATLDSTNAKTSYNS
jgi:hypothetical protein